MVIRRWSVLAALPVAVAGLTLGLTGSHAATAGTPVPVQVLLCGTWATGADQFSGTSDIDHPSGSSSTGKIYPYHGQTCESEDGPTPADSSTGTYTWTIRHSNVHAVETGSGPQAEFGTEHGTAALSTTQEAAGLNGQIKNFDLSTNDSDGDSCTASDGSSRSIFYSSGAQDTQNSCSPGGPGNFNTHGGASTGQHFRGNYGSTVYQDTDMTDTDSQCNSGLASTTKCFEGVINGFVN